MLKLTHADLMKAGSLLGYNSLAEGVCHGFSCMWAQALLAQDEERFFNRLELIASYKPDFEVLIADCEEAKKKVRQRSPLNKKEKELLEIPAFFDGIVMYLKPHLYADLFARSYLSQDEMTIIYPFLTSKKLKHSELSILFNKSHIFDKTSLTAFLCDLEGVLKEEGSEFPILLDNAGHSACVKYSNTKQKWLFIDTNDFSRYPDTATYFRELETSELVSSLFVSLSHSPAANVLLNTKILSCANQSLKLDLFNALLTQLDLQYPVTPELAIRFDNRQLGLLYLVCQHGDLKLGQDLLKHPEIAVNQATSERGTPLYIACQNGHLTLVAELLKHPKIAVNQATGDGATPLFIACQYGHLAVVTELLKYSNIGINQAIRGGATPLSIACHNGHLAIVAELLKHPKLMVNQARSGETTPLYAACQNGHLAVVVELLKHPKLAVNQVTSWGVTPLYIACENGHLVVVVGLLKHPKLAVNQATSWGVTPLYIACQNGHLAVVVELLKHPKLAVNQATSDGATPLFIACQNGHLAVVAKVLKHPDILINQAKSNGVTALYMACQKGYLFIVAELLKHPGLLINQETGEGLTPLHIACNNGHPTVVAELLKHPDILINQAKSNGVTALYSSCQNNQLAIVELLVNYPGIDINSRGVTNHTPLLVACLSPHTRSNEKLFELLLNKKASLHLKNDQGQTALDIAIEQNNTAALLVLLKFMLAHSLSPLTHMSLASLDKTLGWAKEQCPEVADYLAKYKSTGSAITFFAEPMTNLDPQNEALTPRNST